MVARLTCIVAEAITLLPEEEQAPLRQVELLERRRAREVVDPEHHHVLGLAPVTQGLRIVMVHDMQVAVRDHGSTAIPPPAPDDVHRIRIERIRRADDRADVEVVVEILDPDMEGRPAGVEVGHDRLNPPVPIGVDDIAGIPRRQQVRVQPRVIRPGLGMRADADGHVTWIHDGDDSLDDMPSALAAIPALGPDVQQLLTDLGPIAFWVVVAIIFAECGLLIGFFLPGDSLLFITGLLIARASSA